MLIYLRIYIILLIVRKVLLSGVYPSDILFRGLKMNYTFNFKPKSYPDPGYYKIKPESAKVRTPSNDSSDRRKLIKELPPEDISLSVGVPIT